MRTSSASGITRQPCAQARKPGNFAAGHAYYRKLLATLDQAQGIQENKMLFGELFALLEQLEIEIKSTGAAA
jgi:hypothetical protein